MVGHSESWLDRRQLIEKKSWGGGRDSGATTFTRGRIVTATELWGTTIISWADWGDQVRRYLILMRY